MTELQITRYIAGGLLLMVAMICGTCYAQGVHNDNAAVQKALIPVPVTAVSK